MSKHDYTPAYDSWIFIQTYSDILCVIKTRFTEKATFFQPHYGNDAYQFASSAKTGRSSPGFYNNKQPIEWEKIVPTILVSPEWVQTRDLKFLIPKSKW